MPPPSTASPCGHLHRPQAFVLPVLTLAAITVASFSRYMRSSMMDAMAEDYVRTARAKGASQRRVLYGHALRNALIPIVTLLGLSLPAIVSGAVITETVFNYPGMGLLTVYGGGEHRHPPGPGYHPRGHGGHRGRVTPGRRPLRHCRPTHPLREHSDDESTPSTKTQCSAPSDRGHAAGTAWGRGAPTVGEADGAEGGEAPSAGGMGSADHPGVPREQARRGQSVLHRLRDPLLLGGAAHLPHQPDQPKLALSHTTANAPPGHRPPAGHRRHRLRHARPADVRRVRPRSPWDSLRRSWPRWSGSSTAPWPASSAAGSDAVMMRVVDVAPLYPGALPPHRPRHHLPAVRGPAHLGHRRGELAGAGPPRPGRDPDAPHPRVRAGRPGAMGGAGGGSWAGTSSPTPSEPSWSSPPSRSPTPSCSWPPWASWGSGSRPRGPTGAPCSPTGSIRRATGGGGRSTRPASCIVLVVVAFNFVGDALRDALEVRARSAADRRSGGTRADAGAAAGRWRPGVCSGKWQAAGGPPPNSVERGLRPAATSSARGQRVRKRHPDGGSIADGQLAPDLQPPGWTGRAGPPRHRHRVQEPLGVGVGRMVVHLGRPGRARPACPGT